MHWIRFPAPRRPPACTSGAAAATPCPVLRSACRRRRPPAARPTSRTAARAWSLAATWPPGGRASLQRLLPCCGHQQLPIGRPPRAQAGPPRALQALRPRGGGGGPQALCSPPEKEEQKPQLRNEEGALRQRLAVGAELVGAARPGSAQHPAAPTIVLQPQNVP